MPFPYDCFDNHCTDPLECLLYGCLLGNGEMPLSSQWTDEDLKRFARPDAPPIVLKGDACGR